MTGLQRLLEAGLILCGALAIFLLTALLSFDPADPSWSQTGYTQEIQNAAGAIGAWFADILLFSFGALAYSIPFVVVGFGYVVFHRPRQLLTVDYLTLGLRLLGILLFLAGATGIAALNFADIYYFPAGGLVGSVIIAAMLPYFNLGGTTLLLLTFILTGITLITGLSWIALVDKMGAATIAAALWIAKPFTSRLGAKSDAVKPKQSSSAKVVSTAEKSRWFSGLFSRWFSPRNKQEKSKKVEPDETWESLPVGGQHVLEDDNLPSFSTRDAIDEVSDEALLADFDDDDDDVPQIAARKPQPPVARPVEKKPQLTKAKAEATEKSAQWVSELPSIQLLDRANRSGNPISQSELDEVSRTVESVLKDFGVEVQVAGVQPGPVVTRFELDLAPGVKVSKISNLAKDIARSLSAIAVRVVEVIPGKSYVGLELPNKHREIVRLSEVLESEGFAKSPSPLSMVLGKDIAGKPVTVDLAKMPHLLVAGTTGSGKSVGINVMILSMLYKSQPEDVRMIMIDPKMLELSVYDGIPHLLTEVVTDMKDAANALRWCVGEMERRYKLMSALGVRNLKGYNQKVEDAIAAGEPLRDPIWKPGDSMDERPPELGKLPYIVVVVDELADMMMIVGKKVEELIARIAQKARAAGIHLILATQRPSVDVITGLIKANIPTRISFQVSSKIDSRTILDQSGAEHLLGQGDMLYMPPGSGVPVRVHGAFVDDHEVHAVVADWKQRGAPQYLEDILSGDQGDEGLLPGEAADEDGESDPLYDEAVAFVTEAGRVSVSSIQRKFRIGYNRAARIVEQMEVSGVVSAAGHNGAREVLAAKPPRDY
ncbi:MAG: DNA translocase FtsK 4TM domain-containing protein [Aliidiomarina sp.]|uniref:DNA translocase FtsK n=1 Tax=Aliidiomarina sp. TaxID=1872439 RepID=UPI0025BE86F7|nr:DNA translocase FtsK 4TM domain-containing protein [Aliidiomarina sp.]MCH8501829.1 DNA translocase FtsK 4TM domain-containing protein [Aliidiomarina sp.]